MNKLFLIGVFLLSACATATPETVPTLQPTVTRTLPTVTPVTITPTSTPFPLDTPTPQPPERYFIEEFDVAPSHWSTLVASGDTNLVEIINKESALTFELYAPITWVYAIYGAFTYESVHIETQVKSQGSKANSMGLVCHYDEQEGWYEFNIANDGNYNLLYGQWLAEGIARYTPILNDTSDRIRVGDATNELGLDCYENIVQIYINGKLIRKMDVSRFGLSGGKVGLSLGTFEGVPVILSFKRVKVSKP